MAEQSTLILEEITDPAELARAQAQDERHRRNQEWLAAHWSSLLPRARGQFVAVARQEAFIAPPLQRRGRGSIPCIPTTTARSFGTCV